MKATLRLAFTVLALVAAPRLLASPFTFSYGGRLSDHNDNGVKGPVDLEIKFYNVASGGSAIGVTPQVFSGVALDDGVYQVDLTLIPAELATVFTATDTFVEVTDKSHGVTYPRQKMTAIPYALKVPIDGKTIKYDENGSLTVPPPAAGTGDGQLVQVQTGGKLPTLDGSALTNLPKPLVDGTTVQLDGNGKLTVVGGSGGASSAQITALSTSLATTNNTLSMTNSNLTTTNTNLTATNNSLTALTGSVVKKDGSVPLIATWNEGGQDITSTGSIVMNGSKVFGLSVATSDPANLTAGDIGKIWYNGGIKLWNGASAQSLGIAGAGLMAINSLNSGTQTLSNAVTGTTPAWNSAGSTHTLNIPMANAGGAVTAGLISNAEWVLFNGKQNVQPAANAVTNGYLSGGDWVAFNAKQPLLASAGFTGNGYLTSSDWALFNAATTKPYVDGLNAAQAANIAALSTSLNTTNTNLTTTNGTLTTTNTNLTALSSAALKKDGSVALTATWNVGNQDVTNTGNVSMAGSKVFGLSVATSDPANLTAADVGKIWYNGGIRFWNGSSAQSLGISGAGVMSINTLNSGAQTLATGTAGTSPAWVSAGSTHTLNIPQGSLTASGFLASGDWQVFNAKQPAGSYVATSRNVNTTPPLTGGGALSSDLTLSIASATVSANGYLASADWAIFNGREPPVVAGVTSQYYRGDKSWQTLSTATVPEASNLYYTTTRAQADARSAIGAAAPLQYNAGTGAVSLPPATLTANGYLASADWALFNAKDVARTTGNLTETTSSILTITGGSGSVIGTGTTIAVTKSSLTASGYLGSGDWQTFNAKQPFLGYAPVSRAGDTMAGALNLPSNGLALASNQLVAAGGFIGVGTNNPGSMLQVFGNAAIGYGVSTPAPVNGLTVSGSVGIGTTNPGSLLDMQSSAAGSAVQAAVTNTNTSGAARFVAVTASAGGSLSLEQLGNASTFGHNSAGDAREPNGANLYWSGSTPLSIASASSGMRFYTGGDQAGFERMRISAVGNVGVGLNNPTNTLHVGGSLGVPTANIIGANCGGTITLSGTSWHNVFTGTGSNPTVVNFPLCGGGNQGQMLMFTNSGGNCGWSGGSNAPGGLFAPPPGATHIYVCNNGSGWQ